MHRHFSAILVLLLCGCQAGTGYQLPTGPVPEPVISTVTLNQPFPVRADRANEYIQDGTIMPYEKITEYYPHCIFSLRSIAETARTIQPETFMVTRLHRDRFMAWAGKLMVASSGGGDFNMIMSDTSLDLHSDSQPEVFRLVCRQLDDPWRARHVSAQKMQQTLGDLFTLH